LCGVVMGAIQLYWFFKHKRDKLSTADVLYGSMIAIIIAWILLDLITYTNSSLLVADFYMIIIVFITTIIAIVGDLFALSLKREIQVIDIIILFPVLLISTFYVMEGNWDAVLINGKVYYHFMSNDTFYWLASMLFVVLLNLNLLYRLSDWFKRTWAYKRMFALIISQTIGITLVVVANVFMYPWFVSARLGSFFLAFALFLNFWLDQRITKKKICVARGADKERQEALDRICEFL
jgi:hypothetical protein